MNKISRVDHKMKTIVILSIVACAFGRPQLDGRIVGSIQASIQVSILDYPYQVSLQHFGSHICGASIISANAVLTSAQCTASISTNLSVRAGTSLLGIGGQVVDVSRVHQHPFYNETTLDYDVSVLELKKPLILGPNVAVIALQPINQEPAEGSPAKVTGWGLFREGGFILFGLQVLTLKYVSRSECNSAYGGDITPRMICYATASKGACPGDSGGPLVANNVQVGIVSWAYECARPKFPGVYSRLANREIFDFIAKFILSPVVF